MNRLFTKVADGSNPNGRWFAGDVNALQDAVAAISDYAQTIGLGFLAIGESGLQLLRFGAGEARLTGHLRVDGILRGLSGLMTGSYTTTARNAIAAGQRPPTMLIWNSTTGQYEYNAGSDATPNWLPIAPPLAAGVVGTTELAANAVTSAKIADGTITTADLGFDVATQTELNAVQAAAQVQAGVSFVSTSASAGQHVVVAGPQISLAAGTYIILIGHDSTDMGGSVVVAGGNPSLSVSFHPNSRPGIIAWGGGTLTSTIDVTGGGAGGSITAWMLAIRYNN